MDDLGLIPAIRWQINQLSSECSIDAKLVIEGIDREFSSEVSTHLFRIVQECLSNIRRHAEATRVIVKLEFQSDDFNLTIQDNGKGFLMSQIENPRGSLGITGIQERARLIGGILKIQSEIGQGATVSVKAFLTWQSCDLKAGNPDMGSRF